MLSKRVRSTRQERPRLCLQLMPWEGRSSGQARRLFKDGELTCLVQEVRGLGFGVVRAEGRRVRTFNHFLSVLSRLHRGYP